MSAKIYIVRFEDPYSLNPTAVRLIENREVSIREICLEGVADEDEEVVTDYRLLIEDEEPEEFDADDYMVGWEPYLVKDHEYPAVIILKQ